MAEVNPISRRVASRRLAKAVVLLHRAGQQLRNASQSAPDRYNRDKLHILALGLRDISVPLSKLATLLHKEGEQ
jgi:hypothetical protein